MVAGAFAKAAFLRRGGALVGWGRGRPPALARMVQRWTRIRFTL